MTRSGQRFGNINEMLYVCPCLYRYNPCLEKYKGLDGLEPRFARLSVAPFFIICFSDCPKKGFPKKGSLFLLEGH